MQNEYKVNSYKYLWAASIVLLVALGIRLYLVPLPGHVGDLNCFAQWTKAATENGIAFVYKNAFADYPPGIFYILKPVGVIYQGFFSPTFEDAIILRMLLKIIFTIVDLVTAAMLFFFLRTQESEHFAFWSMTFYALNPAIIYESAYWGQADSMNTFFMLASVLFLMRQRIVLSWIMLTLAILIKMHALILVPLIIFVSWKNHSWKRLLKAGTLSLLVTLIVLLPFIYHGQMRYVKHSYTKAVDSYPYISVNAFNLWWLMNPLEIQKKGYGYKEGIRDERSIVGITYKQLGLLFLAGFTLFILLILWRNSNPNMIALTASAMAVAYFMLPTQIHERYLFPALALLSIVHNKNKHLKIIYGILSLTFFINLQVLPFNDPRSSFLTKLINIPTLIPFCSSMVALLNVIAFGYLIYTILINYMTENDKIIQS